jgi:GNAT superfamily N-acetyltransferase
MYFDYVKERLGQEVIQNEYGFILYYINGQDCFIVDLYVKPEHRRKNIATELADQVQEIAQKRRCTKIWGQVVVGSGGDFVALMSHFSWGLRLHSANANCIVTVKEI